MTAQQKQFWWKLAIGALLIPVAAWGATTIRLSWQRDIDSRLPIAEFRLYQVRDSAEKADIKRIAIEILCLPSMKPTARECR